MIRNPQKRKRPQGGQAVMEFTFVGIPLIFILISIFELSRGMWMYQTLAYAAKAGVRYAIVHGQNCDPVTNPLNNCTINLGPASTAPSLAWVIRQATGGLDPVNTLVTATANGAASAQCSLDGTTNACPATPWPASGNNTTGAKVRIDIQTPFKSAIAMFWPGAKANTWTTVNMYATSSDTIKF